MKNLKWAAALAGLLLAGCLRQPRPEEAGKEAIAGGEGVEVEDRISRLSEQLGVDIPENVQKATLLAQDGSAVFGIAAKEGDTITVLANLPGEGDYTVRLASPAGRLDLGKLRIAKGGWILEKVVENLPSYRTVEVLKGGEPVLGGEFK